ncbi:MAG: 1-(5-phosphoribosyl)-5-[(5-phosphoribosylamino)methylideneamino]imidazole-4-carboxamide isomerase [Aggregatilineales bacterium]
MIVYPAIDLRGGQVVRLREGDPQRQIVFSQDPLVIARQWIDQGAQWLHMVNLDGAFAAANNNSAILEAVAKLGVRVQFGGGLRTLQDAERALEQGAARVVLGTLAVREPDAVGEAVSRWGSDRVCVALDARDGRIVAEGWQQMANNDPVTLGWAMARIGVRHALFTDVARDGSLAGCNVPATIALARATNLQVIASGGVSSLEEIRELRAGGAAGVVIGMALYKGKLTLADAQLAAGELDAC